MLVKMINLTTTAIKKSTRLVATLATLPTFSAAMSNVVFVLLLFGMSAVFSDAYAYDTEQDLPIDNSNVKKVPSTFGMFDGESIDLRTRQLVYEQTDLTMPGNGGLDIVVSRSHNKIAQADYGQANAIGNWHLDIPTISGNQFSGCHAVGPLQANEHYSVYTFSNQFGYRWYLTNVGLTKKYKDRDYLGLVLSIPGQGTRELLFKPGASGEFVTTDNWKASCYTPAGSTVASAFLVVAPNGTKYYFDKKTSPSNYSTWWEDSQFYCEFNCLNDAPVTFPSGPCLLYGNPNYNKNLPCDGEEYKSPYRSDVGSGIYGRRFYDNLWDPTFFYVSKIEDVNGNILNYLYNSSNGQQYLTNISASDGRQVTFTYASYNNLGMSSSTQLLDKATTNDGREVSYFYMWNSTPYNPPLLRAVFLPEGYFWEFDYLSDSPVNQMVKGVRIQYVQNPQFGKVSYIYEKTASDFYGGVGGKRYIQGNVKKRTVTDDAWLVGAWDFTATQTTNGADPVNRTVVTDPKGYLNTYEFIRNRSSWRHGLLVANSVKESSTSTTYKQNASYLWLQRPQVGDNNAKDRSISITYPRVLDKVTIDRDGATFVTTYSDYDKYNHPRHIVETGNTVKGVASTRRRYQTYFNAESRNIIGLLKDEEIVGLGPVTRSSSTPYGLEKIYGYGAISRTFNGIGQIILEVKYGVETRYSYHPDGSLYTVTDAKQNVTRYENYHRGIPQSITTPKNNITRHVLDSGVIEWERDGRLNTTTYMYDKLNRPTRITRPINNVATNSYWYAGGYGHAETTRGGNTEGQTYSGLNQPVGHYAYDATASKFKGTYYDALGRPNFSSFPEDKWDSTVWNNGNYVYYDALGRKITDEKKDSTLDTSVSYEYVADGVVVRDENLTATKLYYASFGNPDERLLVGVLLPADKSGVQAEYNIERDPAGKVKKITELVSGYTKEFVYNNKQQLWKTIFPETGTTIYTYDAAGNLETKTVDTAMTTYGYDGLNRLTSIDYPLATTPDVTQDYDGNGNAAYVSNKNAYWGYAYDENNNLTDETLLVDGMRFHFRNHYDANDHLTAITYPSGKIIDYAASPRGLATQALPFVTKVSHYATGAISYLEYSNGRTETVEITPQKRIDIISHAKLGAPKDIGLKYWYDLPGNISKIDDQVDTAFNRGMGYDNLNRLTSASGKWGAATFDYDTVDNLKTKNVGSTNLSYNYDPAKNRLNTVSGAVNYNLTYDLYGNIKSTKNQFNFLYDDASNLTAASVSSTTLFQYAYDANNRLVRTDKSGKKLYTAYNKAGMKMMEYSPDEDWITEMYYVNATLVADRKLTALTTTDTDGDGMTDKVELINGLNLASAADRNADPDRDDLSNFDEIQLGIDPYNKDSDGDGVLDGTEVAMGIDPKKADSDGDGVSDGAEIAAGTDPRVNIPAVMSIINTLLLSD